MWEFVLYSPNYMVHNTLTASSHSFLDNYMDHTLADFNITVVYQYKQLPTEISLCAGMWEFVLYSPFYMVHSTLTASFHGSPDNYMDHTLVDFNITVLYQYKQLSAKYDQAMCRYVGVCALFPQLYGS